jgi:hypothetical protein
MEYLNPKTVVASLLALLLVPVVALSLLAASNGGRGADNPDPLVRQVHDTLAGARTLWATVDCSRSGPGESST